jgi:hypothetical protein
VELLDGVSGLVGAHAGGLVGAYAGGLVGAHAGGLVGAHAGGFVTLQQKFLSDPSFISSFCD